MKNLKKTKIYEDLTFRNILENLGSAIRKDEDFWAKGVLNFFIKYTKEKCVHR